MTMEVIDNGNVGRTRRECRTATFAESPPNIQKWVGHFRQSTRPPQNPWSGESWAAIRRQLPS